jgi:hypothetical protein
LPVNQDRDFYPCGKPQSGALGWTPAAYHGMIRHQVASVAFVAAQRIPGYNPLDPTQSFFDFFDTGPIST